MHVRLTDTTEFYLKTPQEMSRHEILELEQELKSLDDPDEINKEDIYEKNEDGEMICVSPQFLEVQR